MTRMPNGGKGHKVHLDNLFTSSKLLSTLRDYGIGAAGTVRTGKTQREENEEKRKKNEEKKEEDEREDEDRADNSDISPDRPQDLEAQPALDLIQDIRDDMHQLQFPTNASEGGTSKATKPTKEKNFGMDQRLTELKLKVVKAHRLGETLCFSFSRSKGPSVSMERLANRPFYDHGL